MPRDIYRQPATPFVAEFMGTTNLRRRHASLGPRPARASGCRCRPEALRLRASERAAPVWPIGCAGDACAAGSSDAGADSARLDVRRCAQSSIADRDGALLRCRQHRMSLDGCGAAVIARLRSGAASDGRCREARHPPSAHALAAGHRASLGLLFLGVFLLYPLFNVFGASFLDPTAQYFTFANYARMLPSRSIAAASPTA